MKFRGSILRYFKEESEKQSSSLMRRNLNCDTIFFQEAILGIIFQALSYKFSD